MKVLKSFFIASALLVSAFNVQAATSINLGQAYVSDKVIGSFSHDYEFTLAEDSGVTGVVWGYTLNGKTFTGISDFAYSLTNGIQTIAGTITDFGGTYSSFLSTGSYTLNFSGNAISQGGYYGFETTVSPVSEPAILGLMLAGLGLVGFAAARRKSPRV